jgi:hypothetical protein
MEGGKNMKFKVVKYQIREMGLEDVLHFGKHKGQTVKETIEENAQYINWCLENDMFTLDDSARILLCGCYVEQMENKYEYRGGECHFGSYPDYE